MGLKKIFKLGHQAEEKNKKMEEKKDHNNKILKIDNIKLGLESTNKIEAIKLAGSLLVKGSYVDESYIEAMLKREESLSTYIGNGVAIPHGVNEAKASIKNTGISVLQYPNGIDFGEGLAYLVIGIAGVGKEHLAILSNLATVMGDDTTVEELKTTKDEQYIQQLFVGGMKL